MNIIYCSFISFIIIKISIQCWYYETLVKFYSFDIYENCIKTDLLITNCYTYNNNYTCHSCLSPYYPKGEKCEPITKSVFDCYSYSGDGECFQCKTYNITDDHNCTEPLPHCGKYPTINKCSECEEPYGLNINGDCINKIDHCKEYGKSNDICIECWRGYYPNTQKNACFNTISYCRLYEDSNTCRKCFDCCGLSTDGKQCYGSKGKILGCKIYESEYLCSECELGYTISLGKQYCNYNKGNLYKLELSLIYSILLFYLIL